MLRIGTVGPKHFHALGRPSLTDGIPDIARNRDDDGGFNIAASHNNLIGVFTKVIRRETFIQSEGHIRSASFTSKPRKAVKALQEQRKALADHRTNEQRGGIFTRLRFLTYMTGLLNCVVGLESLGALLAGRSFASI